jgi:hypothetical protein
MELKITKEKVLEAASKCSQAKETLKTLFPECFKETEEIKPFEVTVSTASNDFIFIARGLAPNGYEGRCFGLSTDYDWELTESNCIQILIPKLRQ